MNISIVIPCLNESETLKICINKIQKQLKKTNLKGEIIVSDNGSTDGSIKIAEENGAKVINVKKKGYGNAVSAGIIASTGKYIFIGDADNSYNFEELENFYNKIDKGYDIVQGCRFPSGGGKIEKNAMPLSHKYIGNPLFTLMGKIFFKLPFNDVYCGMKIIRNNFFKNLTFFSGGMIWCLEILIKSKVKDAKSAELPITLHKDGRIKGSSHLRTISDGLKTLKFILICCPKWVYIIPAVFFIFLPLAFLFNQLFFGNLHIFVENSLTEILSSFFLGTQLFMLGLYSTLRSETLGLAKIGKLSKFFKFFSLRLALILSFFIIILANSVHFFDFSYLLNHANQKIFQIFLSLIGLNIIFNSFFVSLLRIDK